MCAADTPPVSARERFGHDIIVSDRAPSNRGTPMIDRNSRACALRQTRVGSQPGGLVRERRVTGTDVVHRTSPSNRRRGGNP